MHQERFRVTGRAAGPRKPGCPSGKDFHEEFV